MADGGARAHLLAVQVIAVRDALARADWAAIAGGRFADDVHPQACADASDAFTLLEGGAAPFGY